MSRRLTQVIRGYVTQLIADAGIALDIRTGLQLNATTGLLIKRIEFTLDSTTVKLWANADIRVNVALRRGKNDGNFYAISNPRVIAEWVMAVTAQASSVNLVIPITFFWDAPPNLVIADEWISLQIISTATGQINTVSMVMYYENAILTDTQVVVLRSWNL